MRKKLLPAFLLALVNTLGFSILIPILPFIVEQYGGGEVVYGAMLAAYPLFQFIAAPLLGSLSDVYGRRKILIISQFGTLLSWVIFAIAYFVDPEINLLGYSLPLIIIFLSRVADGATGGNISVNNAYISDITSGREKTEAFNKVWMIVGIGTIIGPVIGAYSASFSPGYIVTIIIGIVLSIITLSFIVIYLQDSENFVPREKDPNFKMKNELNLLKKIARFKDNNFIRVFIIFRLFFSFVSVAFVSVLPLYIIYKFDSNQRELGLVLLVMGSFVIFNQLFILKRFLSKYGELKTYLIGQAVIIFFTPLLMFVSNIYQFFIISFVIMLGYSLDLPTGTALLTNNVKKHLQGEITGLDASLGALAQAAAPVAAGVIFSLYHGQIFLILSVILLTPFILRYLKVKELGVGVENIN